LPFPEVRVSPSRRNLADPDSSTRQRERACYTKGVSASDFKGRELTISSMQKGTAQRHSKPDGAQRKLFLKNLPFFRVQY